MALTKKITKAVKDAQKQAEAAVKDVRGQLVQIEGRHARPHVDPTPFFAVVGAANIAIDTVRAAGDELEVARQGGQGRRPAQGCQEGGEPVAEGPPEALDDLQTRTADSRRSRRVCGPVRQGGPGPPCPRAQPGSRPREQRQGPVRRRRSPR